MPMSNRIVSNILGLIGAAAGGVFGYVLFWWITRYNFYAMMLPGGMLGLGCGLLARHSSQARGAACGVAALGLGLFTEWKFRPFRDDDSLGYFLGHVHQLTPITQIMIVVGALIAYWLGKDGGFGRIQPADRTRVATK